MSEKEKQELLEQINNLTPLEFSNLCLRVVKEIVKKTADKIIETNIPRADKEVLVNLMIENDIKIIDNN